jgi:HSP20 family molecular chaperone IbpA
MTAMTECTIAAREVEATPQAHPASESTHEHERFTTPLVDIYETEKGLSVVADLPGLTEDQINISVDKDILTIRATAPPPTPREYAWREFETTGYFRQFRLGNKIDQGSIKAEYSLGVLRLSLPFAAEVKPRQIAIKVA